MSQVTKTRKGGAKMRKQAWFQRLGAAALCLLAAGNIQANNLQISNVKATARDSSTVYIHFDIAWENSWRDTNFNHDAAWVFFKVRPAPLTNWQHVILEGTGVNPDGYAAGSGTPVELIVPEDRSGLFVRRAGHGSGTTAARHVRAVWNFASNGMENVQNAEWQAYGVEMVFVAEGTNTVGDGTSATLHGQFEADTSGLPFAITNEAYEITLGGGAPGSLGNNNATGMNASRRDDFNDTVSTNLPAAFPKGYAAFYCMKYEITQGQYADFLNTLTRRQQGMRCTATNLNYYMADTVGGSATIKARNTVQLIADPGDPYPRVYATATPNRACNYISMADLCAILDWMALRPMTELEFEKACRGLQAPLADEYAHGTTTSTDMSGLVGDDGSGFEYYTNGNLNITGTAGPGGVLRAGIFAAKPGASRISAGASYWGIMELSGNVFERALTVGHPNGRKFTGSHGDGNLDINGHSDLPDWPNADTYGMGSRAGGWGSATTRTRVSSRELTAYWDSTRREDYGGRAVRTAPSGITYDNCASQSDVWQGGAYDGWDSGAGKWMYSGTIMTVR